MMKMDGRRMIYSNLYPTGTRTVKCYCTSRTGLETKRDEDMINSIRNMIQNNFKCKYSVRKTRGNLFGGPGIIFKFPVQK